MMGYVTLIKYALWAALIASVVGGIWFGIHTIYKNGYTAGINEERLAWGQREITRKDELAVAVAVATKALSDQRVREVNGLTGALDAASKQNTKLGRDLALLRADGLSINSPANTGCAATSSSKENAGSGIGIVSASRIRLPVEIEDGLYRLAEDAQHVVIQYEVCRKTLMQLVDVVE